MIPALEKNPSAGSIVGRQPDLSERIGNALGDARCYEAFGRSQRIHGDCAFSVTELTRRLHERSDQNESASHGHRRGHKSRHATQRYWAKRENRHGRKGHVRHSEAPGRTGRRARNPHARTLARSPESTGMAGQAGVGAKSRVDGQRRESGAITAPARALPIQPVSCATRDRWSHAPQRGFARCGRRRPDQARRGRHL